MKFVIFVELRNYLWSLPTRERGLKLPRHCCHAVALPGRSLHGSVD
ncbi:hypothetical protein [Caproicibacterium sp. XB2]